MIIFIILMFISKSSNLAHILIQIQVMQIFFNARGGKPKNCQRERADLPGDLWRKNES